MIKTSAIASVVGVVALATCAACFLRQGPAPSSRPAEMADFIRLRGAWEVTQGAGATIAVMDWQFDPRSVAASRYVRDTSLVDGERVGKLRPWHGAWMVELAHFVAPQARIMPIIARSVKADYRDFVAAGIRYAADHGATVVTSSMGPVPQTHALREAIAYAQARGTLFVNVHPEVIADDAGTSRPCDAATCDSRIVRAGIVSTAAHPVKPSAVRDVYSWPYDLKPRYEDGWGYSNAPPVIGGVVALMKSANPSLNPHDLKRLLVQTAREAEGFRVLDAAAAVRAARGLKTGTGGTDNFQHERSEPDDT